MSKQAATSHYRRLLARWPKDPLRPDVNFQKLLQKRIERGATDTRDELPDVNAAYHLLDNAFTRRFPTPEILLRPASSPEHYSNLKRELEEAPKRSWLSNFAKRLQNMVRLK